MAAHSSILAWRIPWREEPGGSMGSQTVGHDLVTKHKAEKLGHRESTPLKSSRVELMMICTHVAGRMETSVCILDVFWGQSRKIC